MTDTATDEFDEKAAWMFVLRLALAQLDRNVDALEDVVHEIIDAGAEYLWYTASYLSSVMSKALVQHCHGDRVAAAQKAADLPDDMAPSVTAANRLIRAWFEDHTDAVANVLGDLECQDLLVDAICAANSMVVAAGIIQQHNGDRRAAAQEVADEIAALLSKIAENG